MLRPRNRWPGRRFLRGMLGTSMLAIALVSCGDRTTINNQPLETSGITVTGRGEVSVPLDLGFISIGVQSSAATVEDARDAAASAATSVIESVKAHGVDDDDIQTSGLSIQPVYDYSRPGDPRLTGYTVANSVQVKVRSLDDFSAIIDDATRAGGDDVRIQGISFGIEDPTEAANAARALAMEHARAKAEQLATLGGVTLGPPVTISESQASTSSGGGTARDEGAATPIEAGTNTVTVDISVRFAISP